MRRPKKAELVKRLETFGDTAEVLPTVYATIRTKFDGHVADYVDYLYRRSILTGRRAMRRFLLNPSEGRMKKDPGFQFAVSKLMFRLWEQQGRPANPVVDGTRLGITRAELDAMTK